MKPKNILISIFFLLTLASCQTICKQEILINRIVNSHEKSQKKKYGLVLIGSGSSIPDHQVKKVIVHYVIGRPMQLDEARELYVYSIEELLNLINSSKELWPYMDNYPFTIDNIDYILAFRNVSSRFDPPYVALMFLVRGDICYAFYDTQKDKFIDEMDVQEPYAEARRIVLGEDTPAINCSID